MNEYIYEIYMPHFYFDIYASFVNELQSDNHSFWIKRIYSKYYTCHIVCYTL